MAIIWRASANPIIIFTNNDVPDLSSAKVTVQCYEVDDVTGVETPLPTGITNVIGMNCTASRSINVATITGVSATNGSIDIYAQSGSNLHLFTIPFSLVKKFLGKAQITISIVDDGYTINCTPPNIAIPANADGSNPILTGAKTRVLLSKAGVNIPVTITSITATGCTASHVTNEATITTVSALTGNLQIHFKATDDSYESYVNVPFSVTKNGNDGANGADGLSVILSNEVHALPANHDGSVTQASIDLAVCSIAVRRGSIPLTPVAANATPSIGQFRYNVQSVTAGTAVRVNNNTFKLATVTSSTCVIKVLIYVESLSNPIEKEMVITKVNGADPTEFNQVKSIFDNWRFAETNEFDGNKIKSGTITADKIYTLNLLARRIATSDNDDALTVNEDNDNSIKIRHSNGQVGIELGLVNGEPRLVFTNANGAKVWEGGMQGIIYVNNVAESWTPTKASKLSYNTDINATEAQLKMAFVDTYNNVWVTCWLSNPVGVVYYVRRDITLYRYSEGVNAQASGNAQYNGYHTDQYKSLTNWVSDGWYFTSNMTAPLQNFNTNEVSYKANVMYIQNGQVMRTVVLNNMTGFFPASSCNTSAIGGW